MLFEGYDTGTFYDEMFEADGTPRPCARLLFERIGLVGDAELRLYQQAAEQSLFRMGITFNVYGDEAGTERVFPFDCDLLEGFIPDHRASLQQKRSGGYFSLVARAIELPAEWIDRVFMNVLPT